MTNRTMLVIGVGGLEGFHIARRLLKEGYSVVGIDDDGKAKTRLEEHRLYVLTHPSFQLVQMKRLNKKGLWRVLSEHPVHQVIVCPNKDDLKKDPSIFRYELTRDCLFVDQIEPKREQLITLNLPIKNRGDNSCIHLFAETVAGPWESGQSFFSTIVKMMEEHKQVIETRNTDLIRLSFIDDVVESTLRVIRLVENGETVRGSYRIEASDMISMQGVWEAINHPSHHMIITLPDDEDLNRSERLPTLSSLTGYKPETSFLEGLYAFLQWYKAYQTLIREGIR
ncbi:NAD-dependent epimerase/dehydratase family protein [Exiguobacterium sp.]|uniref:NAD-dependent epimerase/dehydratase family protein n=1 Tax=Exiguobacterium sp. TaxID=44751 RepID=UPI00263B9513|nr:NAD-dependent epimerase/dehydratase family protein [Exiguobacterium sp.]MCC5891100.1 NAD-dependent epimerase/dehydratase family protein [Exiguobacterium sp.]